MRHFTFISPRTVISVASLLTLLACNDNLIDPARPPARRVRLRRHGRPLRGDGSGPGHLHESGRHRGTRCPAGRPRHLRRDAPRCQFRGGRRRDRAIVRVVLRGNGRCGRQGHPVPGQSRMWRHHEVHGAAIRARRRSPWRAGTSTRGTTATRSRRWTWASPSTRRPSRLRRCPPEDGACRHCAGGAVLMRTGLYRQSSACRSPASRAKRTMSLRVLRSSFFLARAR